MKTKLSILFCLVVFLAKAQTINFPDAAFKTKLLQSDIGVLIARNSMGATFKIDDNGDHEIQQSEALAVKELYVNNCGISTITGIEFFTNLKRLDCTNNSLTNASLSTLNLLTNLGVSNNNITTIDFTGLSELRLLYLDNNQISSLDLSGLPHLSLLGCYYNHLTALNLSANAELINLGVSSNPITTLDISNNSILQYLECDSNQLSSLDVSTNLSLKRVSCAHNQIVTLNFSNNSYLVSLKCSYNNLTSLNIKNGINQNLTNINGLNFSDCWKTGNPNLTTVCADASEVATVQNYLNGCGDTAQVITVVSDCTMGNEEFGINEIKVFPNPTNSTININGTSSIKTIELYDIQGRVLITKEVNTNQTNLDISGYINGVYFVKITTEAGIKREKVIKE